jgi:hypothetical protein
MKLDRVLEDVYEHEIALAKQLRTTAERHAAEHDVYHIGHAQARACAERIEQLGPHAHRYGATPRAAPSSQSPGIVEELRHKSAELLGRTKTSGELLMADLRNLYLAAQAAELAWTVLLQSAQAARDRELLQASTAGQEGATICAKWARTKVKETAPQVYAAR